MRCGLGCLRLGDMGDIFGTPVATPKLPILCCYILYVISVYIYIYIGFPANTNIYYQNEGKHQ